MKSLGRQNSKPAWTRLGSQSQRPARAGFLAWIACVGMAGAGPGAAGAAQLPADGPRAAAQIAAATPETAEEGPAVSAPGPGVLRLATTTSTYETGLLDAVLPPFEQRYGVRVHVISVGTGKALELGRTGDVDVVLVHARPAEDRFIAEGFGVNRRDVMYNDFVILGPRDDGARVAAAPTAAEALARILHAGALFVSRGDDSGTHKKERHLWRQAGLQPGWPGYLEAGQGMSATLRMADEKNAYVLVDRATYLAQRRSLHLVKLLEGDPQLLNPYGIIAVSPYRHPHVHYTLAMALIAWMTSPQCQQLIGDFRRDGHQLYHPDAASPPSPVPATAAEAPAPSPAR